MLETSVLLENSATAAAGGGAVTQVVELSNDGGGGGGSVGGGSEEEERSRGEIEGEKNNISGGNRWPHDETLALLKIRSQMDLAFRDSNLKGPLWDEISRNMGELGYNRNAKKCREKFENIYKYHKRTKDGRSGRQTGKNYRFFEQLELLDNQNNRMDTTTSISMPVPMPMPMTMIKPATSGYQDFSCQNQGFNPEFMSTSTSTTSSSGKESDGSVKKKRKLAGYFERLMKQVLDKQEDLQNKFLEAIEKCERDRIAREEAWKMQEIARLKKEKEALANEIAISAAKDAAVIAFLQKISEQTVQVQSPMDLSHEKKTENSSVKTVGSQENVLQQDNDKQENMLEKQDIDSAGENSFHMSSGRWPKAEVEALIKLRTNVDLQYQDNGSPKWPLWEDISTGMKKLGYDRNAKRCKEKWENINKYYRRVKESQKRRPEDSKTCPYFHLLDSIYQNKSKKQLLSSENPGSSIKAGELLMQIMNQQQQQQQLEAENIQRQNVEQSQ
ncbi:PREDICTED: trihelix transcription factor GT-2-like [Nicotiana attenuata]|uniref:Trihelix transcription factor gt-2 n=1 Tax=Nicotiana attenuata TaxID=49451 RepID=A0A314KYU2_NICAT|nr:PREDICTED: trihelix transcription factor GT-2-like [Nicotiana attenuata]OIT34412.1 trihelix transcription factor gt-2 [Nicotiana attenuata]